MSFADLCKMMVAPMDTLEVVVGTATQMATQTVVATVLPSMATRAEAEVMAEEVASAVLGETRCLN